MYSLSKCVLDLSQVFIVDLLEAIHVIPRVFLWYKEL